MSHDRTLNGAIAADGKAGAELLICQLQGTAFAVAVRLVVHRGRAIAVATHHDPEGEFTEFLDATAVLRACGESAFERALGRLTFESGLSIVLNQWDDLARVAPAMLET